MKFHIVTPSYNQLAFLKRCIASVADQAGGVKGMAQSGEYMAHGAEGMADGGEALTTTNHQPSTDLSIHHHIQDACSTDGTVEFLEGHVPRQPTTNSYQLTFASEADEGMYDAINRGWRLAADEADVIAHLNCDEQYLAGALQGVADFFRQNGDVDVVFADVIITRPDGSYICSRRSVLPNKQHTMTSHLPTFTAATFIRAQAIREHDLYFDCSWKDYGDVEWALRRMDAGLQAAVLRRYTTTFVDSGENMNLGENAQRERVVIAQRATPLARSLKGVWVLQHRLQKWLAGGYSRAPVDYSVYEDVDQSEPQRKQFHVDHAFGIWKDRL